MDFSHYSDAPVQIAVDLVNTLDVTSSEDSLATPHDVAAFLELHVEQGATLDRAEVPIGVVEGIVGIRRWNVTVEGFTNHAGTTPMDQRQDAMVTAARIVGAVPDVATAEPGRQVATVGRLRASPGAPNVIHLGPAPAAPARENRP